jgi:hypothetical protein
MSNEATQTFVIIFRQGPPVPDDVERQITAEETRPWAQQQNTAGYKLDPCILAPEALHRGTQDSPSWPIGALLFLEARDLEQAAQVAASHPALRHRAAAEVRPWTPPRPPIT